MTFVRKHIFSAFLALGLLLACQPEQVVIVPGPKPEPGPVNDTAAVDPPTPVPPEPAGPIIPDEMDALPCVYIETPGRVAVRSKTIWVEFATIKITGDEGKVLYQDDSLKIRGRGNSTWWNYPKKPYYIKLDHQADFYGTGKSKKWVLLANWMDRTLLRNQVAFEASRRTSIEWTPYGRFVELYLNGEHLGNYWLGEKINVEGSKFEAEYLFTFDTSDSNERDFFSTDTYRANVRQWNCPVEVKYPDRDDYDYDTDPSKFRPILTAAEQALKTMTDAIAAGNFSDVIDIDSFCDWYLVHELCYNMEPNHPKSCFFHWRGGKMYAGPVWDFDWNTFTPNHNTLDISNSLWYSRLLKNSAFKARLKERWAELKPSFETLPDYIDEQADLIQESEWNNWQMWPCYPNPITEDSSGMVNHDENLSYQEALNRMKDALRSRISALDKRIPAL